jgi:hypothetical protein
MKYNIELTDTFGGQASYAWVKRATVDHPPTKSIMALRRAAKKAMDLQGVRGTWYDIGDTMEFRPMGAHMVLFVTLED